MNKLDLKYYNADIHRSAFILPQFARKVSSLLDKCTADDKSSNMSQKRLPHFESKKVRWAILKLTL